MVVGLGPRAGVHGRGAAQAAAAAARRARDLGAASLAIPVLGTRAPALGLAARAHATGEGALLGLYRFDRYKEKRNGDRAVAALTLVVPTLRDRAPRARGSAGRSCRPRRPASPAT